MESIEVLLTMISNFGTSFIITAIVIYAAYWYFTKEYPLRREENKARYAKMEDAVKSISDEVALTRQAIESVNRIIEKNTDAYEKLSYESLRLSEKVSEVGTSIKESDKRSEGMCVLLEKISTKLSSTA